MSKIKKIIINIIIFLITIFILCTISVAENYKVLEDDLHVGDKVKIYSSDYSTSDSTKVFCVEHFQTTATHTYKVVNIIDIEGKTATDHRGSQPIISRENAKLAYILNARNTDRQVQSAIWKYFREWLQKVGSDFAGLSTSFALDDGGVNELMRKADNYADTVDSEAALTIKDNTDKENIKFKKRELNNEKYERIGPFNWIFSGKLTSIQVQNESDNNIAGVKYSYYNPDKTEKICTSVSEIKTGKNFYVWIPFSSKTQKIKNVIGTTYQEVDSVTIYCFQATNGYLQNYIQRRSTRN